MAQPGKRYVKGDRAVGRLFKQLPDAMKAEMRGRMELGGRVLLSAMLSLVARRSGRLAGGLAMRLSRSGLRLRVGIIGKALGRRLYYRWIIESGRKAQSVNVHRRGARPYTLRVKPMAPRPFVRAPRVLALRETLGGQLGGYWNGVLARIAQVGSDA